VSVLLIVGPKCTLDASHAAPCRRDIQTDGRTHDDSIYRASIVLRGKINGKELTRWLYCVECPQYSIRLEELGWLLYKLFTSCIRRDSIVDGDWLPVTE